MQCDVSRAGRHAQILSAEPQTCGRLEGQDVRPDPRCAAAHSSNYRIRTTRWIITVQPCCATVRSTETSGPRCAAAVVHESSAPRSSEQERPLSSPSCRSLRAENVSPDPGCAEIAVTQSAGLEAAPRPSVRRRGNAAPRRIRQVAQILCPPPHGAVSREHRRCIDYQRAARLCHYPRGRDIRPGLDAG